MKRRLQGQRIDFKQIARRLAEADKRLENARKNLKIDFEVAYLLAYEGMLKASIAFMLGLGFRLRSSAGHHIAVIDFVAKQLGIQYPGLVARFDQMRVKRNRSLYQSGIVVTEQEARQALEAGEHLLELIVQQLQKKNPQLSLPSAQP